MTCRANLKLLNISQSPKRVKKVITDFDFSGASVSDYIPVVVLKNSQPKFSYMLADFFNMFLKEFCSPNYWEVSSMFINTLDGGL